MKNLLEDKIKAALENYEVAYDPADWVDMEKRLDRKAKAPKITKGIIYSLIISALTITSGLIYYYISGTDNNGNKNNQPEKINPVAGSKSETPYSEDQSSININPSSPVIDKSDADKSEKKLSVDKVNTEELKTKPGTDEAYIKTTLKENTSVKETVNGSSEKNESEISSYPAPKAAFHSDRNVICTNSVVQFYPDNTDIPCEYRWDFGDGEFSGEANPKHLYKVPGNYSVKLQVVSLLDKKSDVQQMKGMITVNPVPSAEFSWKAQSEQQDIFFESGNEEIIEWQWDFGDKQSSTEQKISHQYAKKGNYNVSFSAKNNYGCTGKSQKTIYIANDFNLLAPNAFSPNGDGKNDTWLPVALLSGDYIFSLTILDKNGNVAFKTSSANNPWDGRHAKTNDMVKTGDAFKWIAVVKDKNGVESTYGGVISITESSGN